MSVIPKSAIKLLELQTVSLKSLGIAEPESNRSQGRDKAKSNKFLGLFKSKGESPSANQQKDVRKRIYPINVASWLRFGLSSDTRSVSLCLEFTDSKGEFVQIVDEQVVADGSSAMLSGVINVHTRGPIQSLKVSCGGLQPDDRCYIEDSVVERDVPSEKIA